jgi:hypothetical protein
MLKCFEARPDFMDIFASHASQQAQEMADSLATARVSACDASQYTVASQGRFLRHNLYFASQAVTHTVTQNRRCDATVTQRFQRLRHSISSWNEKGYRGLSCMCDACDANLHPQSGDSRFLGGRETA